VYKLDPGNVHYEIYKRCNIEQVQIHEALPDSGIIDVDDDLDNISYGDLNINVHGWL
jgi:hypothetical protein